MTTRKTHSPGHTLACRLATLMWLLSACSTTHTIEGDGSAADALPPTDAFCPDADGDGARDARCGGDDCDDTDPHIGPHAGVCTGPTRVRECQAAMVSEHDCAAPTPDCDARIGQCAATACGDGVVQPDEQCDGTTQCHPSRCRVYCSGDGQCAALPTPSSCGAPRADGVFGGVCLDVNPGGRSIGERCARDSECESGWCDEVGRCNHLCTHQPECPVGSMCSFMSWAQGGGWEDFRCEWPCHSDAECPSGFVCSTYVAQDESTWSAYGTAACRAPGGTLPLGAPCSRADCSSNNCIASVCTVVCSSDADCPAAMPHCRPQPPEAATSAPPSVQVCSGV